MNLLKKLFAGKKRDDEVTVKTEFKPVLVERPIGEHIFYDSNSNRYFKVNFDKCKELFKAKAMFTNTAKDYQVKFEIVKWAFLTPTGKYVITRDDGVVNKVIIEVCSKLMVDEMYNLLSKDGSYTIVINNENYMLDVEEI